VDGTVAGQVLTWDGNNWIAALPAPGANSLQRNNMQPFNTINYIIALQGLFPSRNGAEPFIGEISMFGGNFAPRGWAFCDGQLLAISGNSALFSLLGTTYGGDGRTTFALPDLRGRAPIHAGNGPGLIPRRLGEKGGAETSTDRF
jgi:microcystin-dependent protein